jgi:hypothetical protein
VGVGVGVGVYTELRTSSLYMWRTI